MTIVVTPLTGALAARVDGVDITRPLSESTWAEVRAAFEEHSVLVFRGQPLDDETQITFSRRFGPLEVTRSMNPAAGTPFARQSNLDIKTGDVSPTRRPSHDLPACQHALAQRQLFQEDPGSLLAAVGPNRSSEGRRHRVRQRAKCLPLAP